MPRFVVHYEEERPGWDEFGGPRAGSDYIFANTKEEAINKFNTEHGFKYCFLDSICLIQENSNV